MNLWIIDWLMKIDEISVKFINQVNQLDSVIYQEIWSINPWLIIRFITDQLIDQQSVNYRKKEKKKKKIFAVSSDINLILYVIRGSVSYF